MAQQTIYIYLAFGTAALCLLLLRVISGGKRVLVKNVKGPVIAGDVNGDANQTYTSTGAQTDAPKSGRDWFDLLKLVLTVIGIVSGVVGAVIAYLTFSGGTP